MTCTLMELTRETCRFPIGDPLEADFAFCGAQRERGPYCEFHARLAYQAPRHVNYYDPDDRAAPAIEETELAA
jgi:hypothetical protein